MVSYKARIFKAKVDSDLLNILTDLKTSLERVKNRHTNLTNFIATYPPLFTEAYTTQEQEELKDLLSTIKTLIDQALTAIPEFIQP